MGASTYILNLHGIGDPERTLEPGEAPYWISAEFFERIVSLCRETEAKVAFTFDDGNRSDHAYGMPILKKYGYTALVFPLAGRLDQDGSLSTTEVRELVAEGFSIGTHGYDHVDWRNVTGNDKNRELIEAREALEGASGTRISAASIPFGSYDRSVLNALRENGYETAYTSDGGASSDSWIKPRLSVRNDMTIESIERFIQGMEPLPARLRRYVSKMKKRLF